MSAADDFDEVLRDLLQAVPQQAIDPDVRAAEIRWASEHAVFDDDTFDGLFDDNDLVDRPGHSHDGADQWASPDDDHGANNGHDERFDEGDELGALNDDSWFGLSTGDGLVDSHEWVLPQDDDGDSEHDLPDFEG